MGQSHTYDISTKTFSNPPHRAPPALGRASRPPRHRTATPRSPTQPAPGSARRTHIFVHVTHRTKHAGDRDPMSAGPERCSGGAGQASQTRERGRAEISRVVLLWRRLSAFSLREKEDCPGTFSRSEFVFETLRRVSPFGASMAICWARGLGRGKGEEGRKACGSATEVFVVEWSLVGPCFGQ